MGNAERKRKRTGARVRANTKPLAVFRPRRFTPPAPDKDSPFDYPVVTGIPNGRFLPLTPDDWARELSKQELYVLAGMFDIAGRSRMSKEQLKRPVQEALAAEARRLGVRGRSKMSQRALAEAVRDARIAELRARAPQPT
jgi:hypothetical protein